MVCCTTTALSQEPTKLKPIKQKALNDNGTVNDTTSSRSSSRNTTNRNIKNLEAKIEDYKIISIHHDSIYVDTTLSISKEYKYNYLRKDDFNLIAFNNIGQTYNTLRYNFADEETLPLFGARARHFNYMETNDINYYYVPTPLTELLFKTAFEQGQLIDAFFSVNTSEQFNFSLAYKALRSLGKYEHSITSTGNLRFTSNYKTKNENYNLRAHVVMQDLLNEENGGIKDEEIERFESGDLEFLDRSIFQVNFENAENVLKGRRFFLDHDYRLISKTDSVSQNILRVGNVLSFEDKYYQFDQTSQDDYFGEAFKSTNLRDKVTLEDFRASLYANYFNNKLGDLKFSVGFADLNYGYNKVVVLDDQTITNRIKDNVVALTGDYENDFGNLKLQGRLSTNISGEFAGNSINAKATYTINKDNAFSLGITSNSRRPNYNFLLYQSDYINYNWYNDYKNVTTKVVSANMEFKKIVNLRVDYNTIGNYTYFQQLIEKTTKPFQTDQTLNYLNILLTKELKYGKFALANTIAYQNVIDGNDILNVPQLTTRNTLYYTSHFFKKALFLQTGVTLKYFTKYNMNAYDPLLAEFYVQNGQEFGGFPMLDFFVNAKIRQTRIYFKAEHFNSSFTGYNYYSAPNNPYRDFVIRFGLVWNFFL